MSVTSHCSYGKTDVYYAPIHEVGDTRRQRETATVAQILEHIFGPGTALSHREDGSPYIEGCRRPISVSHSATWAAVAVGPEGTAVGIDIEIPRLQLHRVAARVMSPEELDFYTGDEGLLAAWTLKEAAYKCAGQPGLDFRRDIKLPCGGNTIKIAPTGSTLRVEACEAFADGWISLVSAI